MRPGVRFGLGLGAKHNLDDSGPIAQIDKNYSAVVATTMDPAGENDLIADLCGHHFTAAMTAAQRPHAIELDTLRAHHDSRTSGLISNSIQLDQILEIAESATHRDDNADNARRAGKTSELKNRCEIGELDSNSTGDCQSVECIETAINWARSSPPRVRWPS